MPNKMPTRQEIKSRGIDTTICVGDMVFYRDNQRNRNSDIPRRVEAIDGERVFVAGKWRRRNNVTFCPLPSDIARHCGAFKEIHNQHGCHRSWKQIDLTSIVQDLRGSK